MENNNTLLALLVLCLLWTTLPTQAQDLEICAGDSVELFLDYDYRGNLQWQQSPDGTEWQDIPEARENGFWAYPVATTSYRAVVTEKDCNPIYSPVQKVVVNIETLAAYNYPQTSPIFMGDTLRFTAEGAEKLRLYNHGKLLKEVEGSEIRYTADTTYNKFVLWAMLPSNACWATSDTISLFVEPFYHKTGQNEYVYAVKKMPFEIETKSNGNKLLTVLDSIHPIYLTQGNTIIVSQGNGSILKYNSFTSSEGRTKISGFQTDIYNVYKEQELVINILPINAQEGYSLSKLDTCIDRLDLDSGIDGVEMFLEEICINLQQGDISRSEVEIKGSEELVTLNYNIEKIILSAKLNFNVKQPLGTSNDTLMLHKQFDAIKIAQSELTLSGGFPLLKGLFEVIWEPEVTGFITGEATHELTLDFNLTVPVLNSRVILSNEQLPIADFKIDSNNVILTSDVVFKSDSQPQSDLVINPTKFRLNYSLADQMIGPYVTLENPIHSVMQSSIIEDENGQVPGYLSHESNILKQIGFVLGGDKIFGDNLKGWEENIKIKPYLMREVYSIPYLMVVFGGNFQDLDSLGATLSDSLEVAIGDSNGNLIQVPIPVLFKVPDDSKDLVNGQSHAIVYTNEGTAKAAWKVNSDDSSLRNVIASIQTPNNNQVLNSPYTFTVKENCEAIISGLPTTWWDDLEAPLKRKFNELMGRAVETDSLPDRESTLSLFCRVNLRLENLGIRDLSIVKYFKNLLYLDCHNNLLEVLDLSENPLLQSVNCGSNKLVSINLSNNKSLRDLTCNNNQLDSLDISSNDALRVLACYNNKISNLDLSNNPKLLGILCDDNRLRSLDLSKNPSLSNLSCRNNLITDLDISNTNISEILRQLRGNPLEHLKAANCKELTTLYLSGSFSGGFQLKTLDISGCTSLKTLNCSENQISELVHSNTPSIEILNCSNNQLSQLDLTGFSLLKNLGCVGNNLTHLDLSVNDSLRVLRCDVNNISSLDLSNNKVLEDLSCSYNNIDSLDLSNNIALRQLSCGNSNIRKIDISNTAVIRFNDTNPYELIIANDCPSLRIVEIQNISQLKKIDLTGCAALEILRCSFNDRLNELTLAGCVNLQELYCDQGQLTTLDLSETTSLKRLFCSSNRLRNLDLSSLPKLKDVLVNNNPLETFKATNCSLIEYLDLSTLEEGYDQLRSIDVRGCTSLLRLECPNNQLSEIDLTTNRALRQLDCTNGKLTNLNLSNNTDLIQLSCANNQLATLNISNTKLRSLEGTNVLNNPLEVLIANDCIALESIDLDGSFINNQLREVNLSGSSSLRELKCGNNQLSNLELSSNIGLYQLKCDSNTLSSINLSSNTQLLTLHCQSNQLNKLDLSNNVSLRNLNCSDNLLSTLDLSKNVSLGVLNSANNQLSTLNISNTGLFALKGEQVQNNPLDTLIAVNCIRLDTIDIEGSFINNQLESIDISGSTTLRVLRCNNNQLTSLATSTNTFLREVACENNLITSLTLENNTALERLYCSFNEFSFDELKKIMDEVHTNIQTLSWSCKNGVVDDNGPDSNDPFAGSDCDLLEDYARSLGL